jgi:hypothetical protein
MALRKFITQAARMQHCTAFSSKIRAQEIALSILSTTTNTTKPPRCSPGSRMLREKEMRAALHRHTTAGIKLTANVRSIGGMYGFFGVGKRGSKFDIV